MKWLVKRKKNVNRCTELFNENTVTANLFFLQKHIQ